MADIATPTFYLVLEKQRKEAELLLQTGHAPTEAKNPPRAFISGFRLQGLVDRLGSQSLWLER